MMYEYRKLTCLKYKDNFYNIYLDNNNKHYFLRTDLLGNTSYITLKELIELASIFTNIPYTLNAIKTPKNKTEKIKIIPKVIIGGISVTLTLSVILLGLELYQSEKRIANFKSSQEILALEEEPLTNFLSYEKKEEEAIKDTLEVDTYLESDWLKYLYIYDMDYLDKALDYENVTLKDLLEVIKNNKYIPSKYQELLKEYCVSLTSKYNNIDLRVLYENLKTLEVVECNNQELLEKTLSVDSYGCYVRTENKIYVLKDNLYEKGTWSYQVLFHEFSHCLRTGNWNIGDKRIKVQIEGQNFNNTITAEALNSLFTVSLFDYEEKDIAYQLQSNYHSVILECLDNYDLSDYVNHSLSYYASKLDEFNNDDNYATTILELIEMQYDDYHNDLISIDSPNYDKIYEYLAKMYYQKYINKDMSYEEACLIKDNLLAKILYDVPEDYYINTKFFSDYLDNYCESLGIKSTSIKR